jgi:pyruvate formate lyase activating enzyme
MKKELTGKVYDIQGFSLQDGPGIRTTVFLKGCPFRCPWCHSPESQQFHSQLSWISLRCVGVAKCGKCLNACSKGAIASGSLTCNPSTQEEIRNIHIDRSVCDNCGVCTTACLYNALYLCGTDYTVAELVKRVSKDIPFYEQSGGGVTISGGEPLSQPEFILQLAKALKDRHIHTAIDTTGYAQSDVIRAVLPYTDLFLYDLKHMDTGQHRIGTGVPNELILQNAQYIAESGGKMQIRIPVVPNFNDSEENIIETGKFCRSLGHAVTTVQILPYHNLGVMKHQRIDASKVVLETEPPSDQKIDSIKKLLEGLGLPVTVH